MKIRISLPLRAAVLSALSAVPMWAANTVELYSPSDLGGREPAEDTVYHLNSSMTFVTSGESLIDSLHAVSWTGAGKSIVFNGNGNMDLLQAAEVSFSGMGDISIINTGGPASAIGSSSGMIKFDQNGNLNFSNNHTTGDSGILYASDDILLNRNGHITITGNSNDTYDLFYSSEKINIVNNGDLTVTGNNARVFSADWDLTVSNNSNLVFTGNKYGSFEQNNSTDYAGGSCLYSYNGKVILSNNGDIIFQGNSSVFQNMEESEGSRDGGAVYASDALIVSFNGNLTCIGNNSEGSGGAFYADDAQFIITNNKDLYFEGNTTTYDGGAIYGGNTYGDISDMSRNGNITFANNTAGYDGGAISYAHMNMSYNGDILLTGNTSTEGRGGAMLGGELVLGHNGNMTVSGNTALGDGGGLYVESYMRLESNKDLTFSGNISLDNSGGAIYLYGNSLAPSSLEDIYDPDSTMIGNGNVSFSNNVAGYNGGAIAIFNDVDFIVSNNGRMEFLNNDAGFMGGAIYTEGGLAIEKNGDVVFRGNSHSFSMMPEPESEVNLLAEGDHLVILNSIYYDTYERQYDRNEGPVFFAALGGREITFYDPVVVKGTYSYNEVTIGFNRNGEAGTIRFSGKYAEEDWSNAVERYLNRLPENERENVRTEIIANKEELLAESKTSEFSGDIELNGGTLLIEEGATVKTVHSEYDWYENYRAAGGTITWLNAGGTLNTSLGMAEMDGASFYISGHDANFRPITNYYMGTDVSMIGGNMRFMVSSPSDIPMLSMTLGNEIDEWEGEVNMNGIRFELSPDAGITTLADGTYTLCTLTNGYAYGLIYDENGVLGSPHLINMTAESSILRFDEETQTLVWEGTGITIIPVIPEELVSSVSTVQNTTWASASNMRSLADASLGVITPWRFKLEPKNNFWGKGLGDFSRHSSDGIREGYEYNAGGYAVGGDRKIAPNTILGLAFGNMYGKLHGRSTPTTVKQDSYVAMLYGAWYKELGKADSLTVQGTLGYGWMRHRMNALRNQGMAYGKWNNTGFYTTLNGNWEHKLNDHWSTRVFAGLEFVQVDQKALTETGSEACRIGDSRLANLSLPIGAGISYSSTLKNGMQWVNGVTLSYVPDVYRHNPEATAERVSSSFGWATQGVSPARNGVRVGFNSALMINQNWTTYAGYEYEGRSHAGYHQVNAGVSYSF